MTQRRAREPAEDNGALGVAHGAADWRRDESFRHESGPLLLSQIVVPELGGRLWTDCQGLAERNVSEFGVVHMFVDCVPQRPGPGRKREPVLAACGITGAKVLLHLMAGSTKDAATVSALFRDMRNRGDGDPLLVVSDGASGIIRACFSRSARPRCLTHHMRCPSASVPEKQWLEWPLRRQRGNLHPVQAFVAEPAVEAVHEGILHWLARSDACRSIPVARGRRRIACDVSPVPLSLTTIGGRPRRLEGPAGPAGP